MKNILKIHPSSLAISFFCPSTNPPPVVPSFPVTAAEEACSEQHHLGSYQSSNGTNHTNHNRQETGQRVPEAEAEAFSFSGLPVRFSDDCQYRSCHDSGPSLEHPVSCSQLSVQTQSSWPGQLLQHNICHLPTSAGLAVVSEPIKAKREKAQCGLVHVVFWRLQDSHPVCHIHFPRDNPGFPMGYQTGKGNCHWDVASFRSRFSHWHCHSDHGGDFGFPINSKVIDSGLAGDKKERRRISDFQE